MNRTHLFTINLLVVFAVPASANQLFSASPAFDRRPSACRSDVWISGACCRPRLRGTWTGADGLIDELRISSARRYNDSFDPAKRLETDEATLALFHFDGDLGAETPAGCRTVVGPEQ